MTPEHIAYEATPEFREYDSERLRWEDARHEAQRSPTPPNRNAETIRFWAMNAALDKARKTPHHLAAFGW